MKKRVSPQATKTRFPRLPFFNTLYDIVMSCRRYAFFCFSSSFFVDNRWMYLFYFIFA